MVLSALSSFSLFSCTVRCILRELRITGLSRIIGSNIILMAVPRPSLCYGLNPLCGFCMYCSVLSSKHLYVPMTISQAQMVSDTTANSRAKVV